MLMKLPTYKVQLGCGLIGIGRPWGHTPTEVPEEEDALQFLEYAFENGIRYFDTAPAYGISELRLGEFLRGLSLEQRSNAIIATKFGEHWDYDTNTSFVDHSFEALKRSLNQSLKLLDKIDILQLHKTTPSLLSDDDVQKAWEYVLSLGVKRIGVSVSDINSAIIACANPLYTIIQLPFNIMNQSFSQVIDEAKGNKKSVVVNRPFNMGAILKQSERLRDDKPVHTLAYETILKKDFNGIILTGTKSIPHLQENIMAFCQALHNVTST